MKIIIDDSSFRIKVNNMRYFFVGYVGKLNDGNHEYGSMTFECKETPTRNECEKKIKERSNMFSQVILISFSEFASKIDYQFRACLQFVSKDRL